MPNVQFTDNSIEVKGAINRAGINWLMEISAEIESQVVRNSRTDTGDTKRRWTHTLEEQEGKSYIGNDSENALWEELGTGEFAVNGDGRKTPWYVPVSGYTGKKKPTYKGKVEIVRGRDGQQFYKTDGKKPTRAFTKAFETVKPKAKQRAEEIFGGLNK